MLMYLLNQLLYDIKIDLKAYTESFRAIDKLEVVNDKQGRILRVKPKGKFVTIDNEVTNNV